MVDLHSKLSFFFIKKKFQRGYILDDNLYVQSVLTSKTSSIKEHL